MTAGQLGPYELLERLGRGGQGVVFRARHTETGRVVALKTQDASDAEPRWALRREAETLLRLEHPHVVRVLEAGEQDGQPWYAMTLVRGPDILTRFRGAGGQAGPLAPDQRGPALRALRQLALALAYLHGEGVVYRDLKPDNVLIERPSRAKPGEDPAPELEPADPAPFDVAERVVLLDFGLAQGFVDPVRRELLGSLDRSGTLAFMSPEQLCGEVIDARADLYSLGGLVYTLLCGRLPFTRPDQVIADDVVPPAPSSIAGPLPAALEELTLSLLAKDRRRRPAGADRVAEVLAELLPESDRGAEPDYPPVRACLYRPSLVGRRSLVERLAHRLRRSWEAGSGACVAIRGPAGIGKTRFTQEVARLLERRGALLVLGDCDASQTPVGRAFAGLDALWTLLARGRRRGAEGPFEQALGDETAILAARVPALAELGGTVEPPSALPADQQLARLVDAARGILQRVAATQPVAWLLDDAQWADELTLALLEKLVRSGALARTRLVVLLTCRLDEPASRLDRLLALDDVRQLTLERLDANGVEEMLSEILGGAPPAELASRLSDLSGGNPLFVTEYARSAVELGLLVRHPFGLGARWELGAAASRGGLPELALPDGLFALIAERLARLSAPERMVVDALAVLGGESPLELIAAVGQLDERTALRTSARLLEATLLAEPRPGWLRFDHPKVREVAEAQLDAALRTELHRRAARALEAGADTDADVPEGRLAALGRHREGAGDRAAAAASYLAAARERVARPALEEAQALYEAYLRVAEPGVEQAVALCELGADVLAVRGAAEPAVARIAEGLARAESLGADAVVAEALAALGELALVAGSLDVAQARCFQARELERRLGRARREAAVELLLGRLHHQRGALEEAREATLAALALLQRIDDRAGQCEAYINMARLEQEESRWEPALGLLRMACSTYEQLGLRLETNRTRLHLANALWHLHRLDEAEVTYRRVVDTSRALGDARPRAAALGNLGNIARNRGRLREAQAHFEASLELNREAGNRLNEAVALIQLSTVSARLGEVVEAQQLVETALELRRRSGVLLSLRQSRPALGRYLVWRGQLDEAQAVLDECEQQLEAFPAGRATANVQTYRAELTRLRGDAAGACRLAASAVARLREYQSREVESDALLVLGLCELTAGDLDAAAQSFAAVAAWAGELGSGYLLAQARRGEAERFALLGDWAAAERAASEALAGSEAAGAKRDVALALCTLARVGLARGEEVGAYLARARELAAPMALAPEAELARYLAELGG